MLLIFAWPKYVSFIDSLLGKCHQRMHFTTKVHIYNLCGICRFVLPKIKRFTTFHFSQIIAAKVFYVDHKNFKPTSNFNTMSILYGLKNDVALHGSSFLLLLILATNTKSDWPLECVNK